jgi:hypothetical protein
VKRLLITARELAECCGKLPKLSGLRYPAIGRQQVLIRRAPRQICSDDLGDATGSIGESILDFYPEFEARSEPFWELNTPVWIVSDRDMWGHRRAGDNYFEPAGGRFWP